MYEIYAKLRDSNGLSDYKVAKDLGFSRTTFVSWREGTYQPKIEKLQQIADYFGVSVEYLSTGEAKPKDVLKEIGLDSELLNMYKALNAARRLQVDSFIRYQYGEWEKEKKSQSEKMA